MQKIQLNLEVAEVNQILSALGNRPYQEVFALIDNIQQQAAPQLQDPRDGRPEVPAAIPEERAASKENDHA